MFVDLKKHGHMRRLLPLIALSFLLLFNTAAAQQKNIVLIAVDDLNDWIGAFGGHPQVQTPNIDKLAEKGVVFTNASCPSPVCNPSRTAFMTGRRPHETGITNNGDGYFREGNHPNWVKNITSMPQYFGEQGFETVAQGKLFHTHGENKGEFEKIGPGGQGCNAGPIKEQIPNTKIEWSKSNQSLTQTGDYKSAKWCGDYLKQNHNKPFFLACGIFRPHLPWFAPKEFYDNTPAIDDIILPPYLKNDRTDTHGGSNKVLDEVLKQGGQRRWKETVQAYLANVAFADACVGKLLNDLENSEYKNNTIVVFIGDHGWHLGEKDHYQKFTMWDRAIKTPMIIYDPMDGGSGPCNKAVSLMDIMPTLLDLTNTQQPNFEVDGRSIGDLVKNPNREWCGVALTSYGNVDHSIRTDRYRYIKYKNGKEEFYDHQNDPNEWTNLVTKNNYENLLVEHRQILNKMLNDNEHPIKNCTNNCSNDSDKDGTDDCNDLCPSDPNKTNPGICGCSEEESPNCGEQIIENIDDLNVITENCSTNVLYWTDVYYATSYRIRRKLINEPTFTNLGDVNPKIETYTDYTAEEGTEYIYMVRPLEDGIAAAISNQEQIETLNCLITGTGTNRSIETFIYPNPANSHVYIVGKIEKWILSDIQGKKLQVGTNPEIDIRNLNKGLFLLKINKQTFQIVKK